MGYPSHRAHGRDDPINAKTIARTEQKKAIVAVAHNLLITAYHVLARQTSYQELAPTTMTSAIQSAWPVVVHALEHQGYRVTLERIA